MKLPQITSKAGFELVFALSIAAIFIIPSMVMAQTSKSTEIIITNGDTVINGKNIKTLSPTERAQALADMQNLKSSRARRRMDVMIQRNGNGMPGQPPMIANDGMAHQYGDYIGGDRITRPMHLRRMNTDSNTFIYKFRMDNGPRPPMAPNPPSPPDMNIPMRLRDRPGNMGAWHGSPNSQRFSYSSTDGNGATTNINYSVNEPLDDEMGNDKNTLDVTDIKLVPDFSTGKTMLSFSLPTKTTAEVEFINSDGKILWSERGSGENFSRTFPLPLNGMYKLRIKQGAKSATKIIMKEE